MPTSKHIAPKQKKWSAEVTRTSDALDIKKGLFRSNDPDEIVRSLEHSAEESKRRHGTAYQSAMSMLNFYINRAGKNLSAAKKKVLAKAKAKLQQDHAKVKRS
jgi:hypothetical protein